MDIVTDTCSVRSVVVITKDAQLFTDAYCSLGDIWHEVIGYAVGIFANHAALMSANRIEIAQKDNIPFWICFLNIHQYLFEHTFGLSIRICTMAFGTFFCDWNHSRVTIYRSRTTEDDILALMLAHHIQKNEGASHIIMIVLQGLCNRLTHCFQSCKMNNCIEFILIEDLR